MQDTSLKEDIRREIDPGHLPVFYESAADNRTAYFESHKLNTECADNLEKALNKHFQNSRLDIDAVFDDMKDYSAERVAVVLANTVRHREGDGRFSSANREWADSIQLPESALRTGGELIDTAHSVKVDAFIETFRGKEHSHSREQGSKTAAEPEVSETMQQPQGPNMAEVQAAESRASVVQGLARSADGASSVKGRDVGYLEEDYVMAADQVKYEAQRARTADGDAKGQEMEAGIPKIGQRVTFQESDTKKELTGQVTEMDDATVTLKCGRAVISTLRDKGVYTEAPEPDPSHTKDYAKTKALEHVGEQGKVFLAKAQGVYKGSIVETTPTFAIQKVNAETAVLHRLKDLSDSKTDGLGENAAALMSEGRDVIISKTKAGVTVQPWDKEREEKQQVQEREQGRGSQAR